MFFSFSRRGRQRNTKCRPRTYRPRLERLEDRVLMTVRVWDGGALLNDKWTDADNWTNGKPVEFDELIFPDGVGIFDRSTNNDFPSGTTFNKITITGINYNLSGNPITIGSGGLLMFPSPELAGGNVLNHIECDIKLSAGLNVVEVQTNTALFSTLILDGVLSGATSSITKVGNGGLSFEGSTSNSCGGDTVVKEGGVGLKRTSNAIAVPRDLIIGDNVNAARVNVFSGGNQIADTSSVQVNGQSGLALIDVSEAIGDLRLNGNDARVSTGSGTLIVKGDVTDQGSSTIFGNLSLGKKIVGFTVNSGSLTVDGAITGTGVLEKRGIADLVFKGTSPNTFSGETRVLDGRLFLQKATGVTAIPGPLTVGDVTGAEETDRVILSAPDQISNTAAVKVNRSGLLDFGASSDAIGPLTLIGGKVIMNSTTVLKLTGALTNIPNSNQAQISGGQLDLGSSSRIVNVEDDPVIPVDLVISSKIIGQNSGLTKNNAGTLLLANQNDQGQPTRLSGGSLLINGSHVAPIIVSRGVLGGIGTAGGITMNDGIIDAGVLGPGVFTFSTLTAPPGSSAAFRFDVNGATAGTQVDQLKVTGINIFGKTLDLSGNPTLNVLLGGGFAPALGTQFKIVDITVATRPPANGVFKDPQGNLLNEGSALTVNGQTFTISYVGGDGNDVVLTRNSPPAFQNRSVTTAVAEGGTATLKGTITEADAGDTFFLDVNWGDGTPQETFTFSPGSPRDVSVTHQYPDDNPSISPADFKTIQLVWRDQRGGSNKATLPIIVYNLAPTLSDLAFSSPAVSGQEVTLSGRINDSSARDTFTLYINWGDGTALETRAFAAGTKDFTLTHRFARAGAFRTTLIIRDDDFGFGIASASVTVNAPAATSSAKALAGGKVVTAVGLDAAAVNALFAQGPLAFEPRSRGRGR